jgi:antitoxin ParD1/3/4
LGAVEKLSIALTPELATDIREAVSSGEYASTSEVIRDALRAWTQRRRSQSIAVEQLRQLWQEGLDSGHGLPLDAENIKRRGRERLAAIKSGGD